MKNGYIADRHIRQSNGKTGQENFDSNLLKLKLQVETMEKNNQSQPIAKCKGKHYVISDIHGFLGSYQKAVSQLKSSDTLYILGDVIDRGENGIKILQDIIRRQKQKNGPEIIFLLGNHEIQMMECFKIMSDNNICTMDELKKYCEIGKSLYYSKQNGNIPKDRLNKNLTSIDMQLLYVWLYGNKGYKTFNEYIKLSPNEQIEISNFLKKAYVIYKSKINNKKICLVHAAPPNSKDVLDSFENIDEGGYRYSNIPTERNFREIFLEICTETRDSSKNFELWKNDGYTTIIGHTPSPNSLFRNPKENSICVDAACSMGGKLALYCIEDDKAIFIDNIEQDINSKNR